MRFFTSESLKDTMCGYVRSFDNTRRACLFEKNVVPLRIYFALYFVKIVVLDCIDS